MVDIDQFRSQLSVQKPDRYRVRFPLPPIFVSSPQNQLLTAANRTMEFFTDSVDWPGMGWTSHNVSRYGYGASEKKPFAPQFQDIMITFYNDAQSLNMNFFKAGTEVVGNYNMSDGIVTNAGSPGADTYEMFYKDDYAVDGQITLIDTAGNDVVTYRVRRMFPIEWPNFKLAWANANDIMKMPIIFTYVDWYIDYDQQGTLSDAISSVSDTGQQNVAGATSTAGSAASGPPVPAETTDGDSSDNINPGGNET